MKEKGTNSFSLFNGKERFKGRTVYNGKPTREWLGKEDSMSPTAGINSIFLIAMIAAWEDRDVMMADVPNAFIQTNMPDGNECVIMKITGVLVDIIVLINPEKYNRYVVYKKGRRVLYLKVLQAIYGMLQSALLWYELYSKSLKDMGFIINPYDLCVANSMI